MPVVEIYGTKVQEHSKYKGYIIYKGENSKWFAEFTNETGWVEIISNNSLADLKIDINYQISKGRVKA